MWCFVRFGTIIQFKKCPWRSITFSEVAGWSHVFSLLAKRYVGILKVLRFYFHLKVFVFIQMKHGSQCGKTILIVQLCDIAIDSISSQPDSSMM